MGWAHTAPCDVVTFTQATGASQVVSVPVVGDTTSEADETLQLKLAHPVGGVLGDTTGTGTIVDDDGHTPATVPPSLQVDDPTTVEGDSGLHAVNFHVTLDHAA